MKGGFRWKTYKKSSVLSCIVILWQFCVYFTNELKVRRFVVFVHPIVSFFTLTLCVFMVRLWFFLIFALLKADYANTSKSD